jgi:hypothetical protein
MDSVLEIGGGVRMGRLQLLQGPGSSEGHTPLESLQGVKGVATRKR